MRWFLTLSLISSITFLITNGFVAINTIEVFDISSSILETGVMSKFFEAIFRAS